MAAWLPIAIGASAAAGALSSSRNANRQHELSEAELDFIRQRYADREPLRAMGMGRLEQPLPERPNLDSAFADPSNPFSAPRSPIGFGEGYSSQTPEIEPYGGPPRTKEELREKLLAGGSPWAAFTDQGNDEAKDALRQRMISTGSPWAALGMGAQPQAAVPDRPPRRPMGIGEMF